MAALLEIVTLGFNDGFIALGVQTVMLISNLFQPIYLKIGFR